MSSTPQLEFSKWPIGSGNACSSRIDRVRKVASVWFFTWPRRRAQVEHLLVETTHDDLHMMFEKLERIQVQLDAIN